MRSVVKESCGCNSSKQEAQCCAKVSTVVAGCHDWFPNHNTVGA